jgi:hypothetical protein
MGVARKPIELGNHQRGFVFLCDRQGLGKLRPLGIGLRRLRGASRKRIFDILRG